MDETRYSKQRKERRFAVDWTGLVKSVSIVDEASRLQIVNISSLGARIRMTERQVKVGETLALMLTFQNERADKPVIALAIVRWLGEGGLMGLEFTSFDPTSRKNLDALIEMNEKT